MSAYTKSTGQYSTGNVELESSGGELSAGKNDHAIHLIGIAPTAQRQVGVGFEFIDGEPLPSTRGSAHLDMKAMSFSSPSTSSRLLPTTELMSSLFCFSLGIVGNSSLRLAS